MENSGRIVYCVQCGTTVKMEEKFGSNRPVCPACGWIYFTDPKVAVAVVVLQDERVLLTRRVNEPHQGDWSLPAGFMDAGETIGQAGARECLEETGLRVNVTYLIDIFSGKEHPHGADIVLVYRAEITGWSLTPGDDADRAEFFQLDNLPPLAFESTRNILHKIKDLS
jgi:8-oxo-dGTP diphosphatase